MDQTDFLNRLAQSAKTQIKPNRYWGFDKTKHLILNKRTGKPLVQADLTMIDAIQNFFQGVYDAFGTEAQCLVIEKRFAKKLSSAVTMFDAGKFIGVVVPQINTHTNSLASQLIYQREIVNNHIPVYLHAHSHDDFDAYRSITDYNGLNSNTLELVFGNFNTKPTFAFWLDSRDSEIKQPQFVFDDFGQQTQINQK